MTAAYTALARRYRPQTFDEVIGQGHVATALRNAIRKDRVSHAYLFTGARGVGKTSTARIFAKALNCPNAVDGVPCNVCDLCEAISIGGDVDVTELDAASNRGIDEIRQLRANVNLRPMRAAHKIYIIDEAHQLTRDAWNALLKTLEEPPPYVKFFFCTTEPSKLPDTILSRCQRFDFSTVDTPNIVERLAGIAGAEGYSVEPAALELVARRAGGSMRDSQSLFDQLLAFGSETISVADVHRLFGTADDERLIALAETLVQRQPGRALEELNTALDAGVQLGELFDQLIGYFRDLMVIASKADGVALLSVREDRRPALAEQATTIGLNTLLAATQILSESRRRMERVAFARPFAELAVTRIALLRDLDELADLIGAVRSGTSPSRRSAAVAPQKKSSDRPPLRERPSGGNGHANHIEPPTVSAPATASPPAPAESATTIPVEPADSAASVPFERGREAELLTELKRRAETSLEMALAGVSRTAIIGPNALELTFPKGYSQAVQSVEGPNGRSRIEQLLAEITGQSIRLSCRLADEDPATSPENAANVTGRGRPGASRERQRAAEVPEEDEFVQKAVSVFEARVLKVTELSGPAGS